MIVSPSDQLDKQQVNSSSPTADTKASPPPLSKRKTFEESVCKTSKAFADMRYGDKKKYKQEMSEDAASSGVASRVASTAAPLRPVEEKVKHCKRKAPASSDSGMAAAPPKRTQLTRSYQ
jgi:hypothetical protein